MADFTRPAKTLARSPGHRAEWIQACKEHVYVTDDGGENWKRVADVKPKEGGFLFTTNWFGCYAWDPVNRILYASSMGNPVFKLKLSEK